MFTYFAHRPSNGLTKIGRSKNPRSRFYAFAAEGKVDLIGLANGDREREMHDRYDSFRVRGEWFNIPADQMELIREEFSPDKADPMPDVTAVQIKFSEAEFASIKKMARANYRSVRSQCHVLIIERLDEIDREKAKEKR